MLVPFMGFLFITFLSSVLALIVLALPGRPRLRFSTFTAIVLGCYPGMIIYLGVSKGIGVNLANPGVISIALLGIPVSGALSAWLIAWFVDRVLSKGSIESLRHIIRMGKKALIATALVGLLLVGSYFLLKMYLFHSIAKSTLELGMKEVAAPSMDIPPQGYVPDKSTAISISVSLWRPLYGDEHIKRQAPYRATLVDGVWVVVGTGQGRGRIGGERISAGGVAHAFIRQETGEILRLYHEY